MKTSFRRYGIFLGILVIFLSALFGIARAPSAPPPVAPTAAPTSALKASAHVATPGELETAFAQWTRSRHANTFDDGQGANTTCASCKSPHNWDPDAPSAEISHDCALCKREPGKPRPELPGGVLVSATEWKSIACEICHQPVGNSYSTALAFWNQETRTYEPISVSAQLCAKCHIGAHGFDVIREQTISPAHTGWECSRCHGAHNTPVKCVNCHDPAKGRGGEAHAQHPNVDCTTCHDAGDLPIWQDPYTTSRYFQHYMPYRTAHDLRSWPSHNLQTATDCRRCHHPQGTLQTTVASQVRCDNKACHPEGATFDWCPQFPRNQAPKVATP